MSLVSKINEVIKSTGYSDFDIEFQGKKFRCVKVNEADTDEAVVGKSQTQKNDLSMLLDKLKLDSISSMCLLVDGSKSHKSLLSTSWKKFNEEFSAVSIEGLTDESKVRVTLMGDKVLQNTKTVKELIRLKMPIETDGTNEEVNLEEGFSAFLHYMTLNSIGVIFTDMEIDFSKLSTEIISKFKRVSHNIIWVVPNQSSFKLGLSNKVKSLDINFLNKCLVVL